MVKYFSVDWLAQSHCADTVKAEGDDAPTCRPHILCVAQPRPPTFGKGYLQPKPKPTKAVEHMEITENSNKSTLESSLSLPAHSTTCSSPNSSGYSSGYESEAASSSECHFVDEGSEAEKDAPQRRVRTKFTPEQISKLEKIFNKHKYLDAGERVKTAQKLNLTETQVRTWFQNRRMKMKREVQDYFTPQVPSVVFQPLAPVQYPGMVGQGPHYPVAPGHPPYYYHHSAPVQQMVLQQLPPRHHHPSHLMIHNHPRY